MPNSVAGSVAKLRILSVAFRSAKEVSIFQRFHTSTKRQRVGCHCALADSLALRACINAQPWSERCEHKRFFRGAKGDYLTRASLVEYRFFGALGIVFSKH